MKNLIKITKPLALTIAMLSTVFSAEAVPVLQVGAPDGNGGYADYVTTSTNPAEADTAITNGLTIYFAGITQGLTNLGGKYLDGPDWSSQNFGQHDFTPFNGQGGAIALLVVENNKYQLGLSGGITLGGQTAFLGLPSLSGLFDDNHAPLNDDNAADFLFFNIGNFDASSTTLIPDFDTESAGTKKGEIKSLALAGTNLNSFKWIHFDLLALATTTIQSEECILRETNAQGNPIGKCLTTTIVSTFDSDLLSAPNSHDVTFKNNDFCDNPQGCDDQEIPEPDMLALLGIGLLGMAMTYARKRSC